ncbi:pilus assembly protein TadG-related protein [Methylocella sp. CPCC 101449]|uniref:pilus assembly protein TadG-related protein n=1 Tax=Methylocella sp. CPCC 101449 TaxID=2987531 RepID=UPI00288CCC93|nr:pilus assembly protein TadG-related protein [Methylocella sp. CPCC 101449]MDT2021934.1 TadG family pilus assembly protein [Methylocella sp. CPCC 101449]
MAIARYVVSAISIARLKVGFVPPRKHASVEFVHDCRGSTMILTAIALAALMGFVALSVDLGSLFFQKRRQQTANDLAALAAASDLSHASAAALATLARNQTPTGAGIVVETGTYTPDPALTPSARFVPNTSSGVNAARVTVQSQQSIYFGRILSLFGGGGAGPATVNVQSSAIAATNAQAAFTVGSRLFSLNGGVLNSVLGGLLGTSISLSLMDYQSLVSAKIDLFSFMDKLATRLNLTGLSYSQILSTSVHTADALQAVVSAASANSANSAAAIAALSQIANAKQGSNDLINLSSLLSLGVYGVRVPGEGDPLTATISALNLVSSIAQVSGGTNQLSASLSLGLPGISSVNLALAIGARPVSTSAIAVGSIGSTAYTAQTRLLLTVSLIGSGKASLINVPIYISIASAYARLTALSCSPSNLSSSSVTLGVKPGIIDAWIGNISMSDMTNFTSPPSPGTATLVNAIGVVTVTGSAHASISNMTETPLTFSYADISSGTVKSTSTTDFTTSLITSLITNLNMQATALGGLLNLDLLGLGGLGGTQSLVTSTLTSATGSIDTILNSVLTALGINIGEADAWVTGVSCGNAVLVN